MKKISNFYHKVAINLLTFIFLILFVLSVNAQGNNSFINFYSYPVFINAEFVAPIHSCKIDGDNYFLLQDVIKIMKEVEEDLKELDTIYDNFYENKSLKNESLTILSEERNILINEVQLKKGKISVSGNELFYYEIDGEKYCKLKDIEDIIQTKVKWNETYNSIEIYMGDWKEVYFNILTDAFWILKNTNYFELYRWREEYKFPDGIYFGLQDINQDNVPELLFSYEIGNLGGTEELYIISLCNNSLNTYEFVTYRGGYSGYDSEKNIFALLSGDEADGIIIELYQLENYRLKKLHNLYASNIWGELTTSIEKEGYFRNNQEVSETEFKNNLSEYNFENIEMKAVNNENIKKYIIDNEPIEKSPSLFFEFHKAKG